MVDQRKKSQVNKLRKIKEPRAHRGRDESDISISQGTPGMTRLLETLPQRPQEMALSTQLTLGIL